MYTRRSVVAIVSLCSLFIVACLLPHAAASEEGREAAKPLADVTISASRVDWRPAENHERLTLTVAGPGDLYIQREFEAGEAPFLSAQESALPDGVYAYELRAGDREPQWGHLWVQGGSFMDKVPAPPRAVKQTESASKPPLRNVTATVTTVLTDDLVVQGQACIGADCGAGDAGGPALKIKESGNYQLLFDGLNCCVPWEAKWAVQANELGVNGDFTIRDVTAGKVPFRIGQNAPDNALYIHPNGNIGVGTLTPAARLDVRANLASLATARLTNSSATGYPGIEYFDHNGTSGLFFGLDNAASTTRLNSVNNRPIVILTNFVERMRVTSGGNVGIGTASPAARLEVSGGEVRFPPGAGAAGFTHFNLASDGKNYIRGTTIIADNAGSVGIGTASPISRLHVNGGDIRVSGGSFIDDGVTLNVPDYVFEPHYELMPLDELRDFVAREKHLPNVPSRDDVKKDGLNLSQIQMRLLEKLEELTLYTLKQDEQIKAQQARIEELQSELSTRLEALEQATAAEPEQQ